MKTGLFCGFNGFLQFGTTHGRKIGTPSDLPKGWVETDDSKYAFSWTFNAFSVGRNVIISGFVKGEPGKQETFTLDDDIKSLQASDSYCLVLLNSGELYKINASTCTIEKLNFTSVERPSKRSIFGEEKKQNVIDPIDLIACNRYICVAVTKQNFVYNIPSKIHEFPKHIKIKDLICGYEHALALTTNGDLYSWGNGLRGQLGHTELKVVEAPTLIEALAGVKMVAASAGGWHSAAISAFGDLYLWGSNINGQLGISVYTSLRGTDDSLYRRKNPTVYALPQLAEICCRSCNREAMAGTDCNVVQVACGGRHTVIKFECGRIYLCGWNEHNQLGQSTDRKHIDEFCELELKPNTRNCNIYCGAWCTFFINEDVTS